ncbi:hypothetical protein ACFE04_024163 [Oxalis oulophora]
MKKIVAAAALEVRAKRIMYAFAPFIVGAIIGGLVEAPSDQPTRSIRKYSEVVKILLFKVLFDISLSAQMTAWLLVEVDTLLFAWITICKNLDSGISSESNYQQFGSQNRGAETQVYLIFFLAPKDEHEAQTKFALE